MLVETLRAEWSARGANARVCALPEFVDGALRLDATTITGAGDDPAQEERSTALVAVAIGRPLGPSAAAHLRRALAKARKGDAPLALTHLALAGIGWLKDLREDARRLFIADGLMKGGVPPRTILALLGDPAAPDDLARAYNPDQPRVPSGNGRPSGQWTSGDYTGDADTPDNASPHRDQNAPAPRGPKGVQIADDSDDWPQFLDPIGAADAAESKRPAFNGVGPNDQHQAAVDHAIQLYQEHGFAIVSKGATAVNIPGFATPRVYDFVVLDPAERVYIGVEIKTTMYDTIFFNSSQVDKDVAIYETGGGFAPTLGAPITRVAYEAFCTFCPTVNFGRASLTLRLYEAGVRVRAYQYPGQGDVD